MEPYRHAQPDREIEWLAGAYGDPIAGIDQDGWAASAWVLHAIYENTEFSARATHDDLFQRGLEIGTVEPLIINGVNLYENGAVATGVPIGFESAPGAEWKRVRWSTYLARTPDFSPDMTFPPCYRWFPRQSWPANVRPPTEGSLDAESFDALAGHLVRHSPAGADTACWAYYGALASHDWDNTHLWATPLGSLDRLIYDRGGPYHSSPMNLWPDDRSWFVYTDWDLWATKVSGSQALIDSLAAHPDLDVISWTRESL